MMSGFKDWEHNDKDCYTKHTFADQCDQEVKQSEAVGDTAKLKKEIQHSFDKVQVNLDLLQGRMKEEAGSLLGLTPLVVSTQ